MSRTPIHPGEILGDEIREIGIASTALARQLKVPENRITQIVAGKRSITADTALRLGKWFVAGKRSITADTALRLGKWFSTTPAFWLNLQKSYELRLAEIEIGKEIDAIPTRGKEPA